MLTFKLATDGINGRVSLGPTPIPMCQSYQLTTSSEDATNFNLQGILTEPIDAKGTFRPVSANFDPSQFSIDLEGQWVSYPRELHPLPLKNQYTVTVHLESSGLFSWVEVDGLRSTYVKSLSLSLSYSSFLTLDLAVILDHRLTFMASGQLELVDAD